MTDIAPGNRSAPQRFGIPVCCVGRRGPARRLAPPITGCRAGPRTCEHHTLAAQRQRGCQWVGRGCQAGRGTERHAPWSSRAGHGGRWRLRWSPRLPRRIEVGLKHGPEPPGLRARWIPCGGVFEAAAAAWGHLASQIWSWKDAGRSSKSDATSAGAVKGTRAAARGAASLYRWRARAPLICALKRVQFAPTPVQPP